MAQHLQTTAHDQQQYQIVDLRVRVTLDRSHDFFLEIDRTQGNQHNGNADIEVIALKSFHGFQDQINVARAWHEN